MCLTSAPQPCPSHTASFCSQSEERGKEGMDPLLYSDIGEMGGSCSPLTGGSQMCLVDTSMSPLMLALPIASQAPCVCG